MVRTASFYELRLRTRMATRFGPEGRWLIVANSPSRTEVESEYQLLIEEFPPHRASMELVHVLEDAETGLQRDLVLGRYGQDAEPSRRQPAAMKPVASGAAERAQPPAPERQRPAATAPAQEERGSMGWYLASALALAMALLVVTRL